MKKRDDLYLREIESRIEKINSHLKKTTKLKFMQSDLHRSAVVRELEVVGEAANKVSPKTRETHPKIPWNHMVAMRNRLIHGYFDVDYSIVWEVAKLELPKFLPHVRSAILNTSPPIHPWRVCPSGYYHVRNHGRSVNVSTKNPDGETSVIQHCRKNPSGKDQLYPREILEIMETARNLNLENENIGKVDTKEFLNGNAFDREILVWTQYWNDIFSPSQHLDPNIVKALLASESTFGKFSKNIRVGKDNFARGPYQITDSTRKILSDEKGEISDHFLTLTAKDINDPTIATSASIRWLFYKKTTRKQLP